MSTEWMDRSACTGKNIELFFSTAGTQAHYAKPRRVCDSCEVTAECLMFALQNETDSRRYGMFGALDPRQRSRLVQGSSKPEQEAVVHT